MAAATGAALPWSPPVLTQGLPSQPAPGDGQAVADLGHHPRPGPAQLGSPDWLGREGPPAPCWTRSLHQPRAPSPVMGPDKYAFKACLGKSKKRDVDELSEELNTYFILREGERENRNIQKT